MSNKAKHVDKLLAKFLDEPEIDNYMKTQIRSRLLNQIERDCPLCGESKPLNSFVQLDEKILTNLCEECLLKDAINFEEYLIKVSSE